MSILSNILVYKKEEIAHQQAHVTLEEMRKAASNAPYPRDFVRELIQRAVTGYPALIAEIKRQSPSRGLLVADFDPGYIASAYISNGAAAISVLTESHFFGGDIETLQLVKALPGCPPILRKDFIFHPYQVYESRLAGADAILLIAAMLPAAELAELVDLASDLGLAVLLEVHTKSELLAALELNPRLLGINNRNLDTFEVSLDTTFSLSSQVPEGICLVSESGIHSTQDIHLLSEAGVDAILVGEALVTSTDLPSRVREFSGLRPSKQAVG